MNNKIEYVILFCVDHLSMLVLVLIKEEARERVIFPNIKGSIGSSTGNTNIG